MKLRLIRMGFIVEHGKSKVKSQGERPSFL